MPTVSVIIPTFNHMQYVGDAIHSVLTQSFQGIEILVIDDGSTDDTERVVKSFGDAVRYVWQANAGLSSARNTGIRLSSGSLIGVLDADDVYEPNFVEEMVALLNQNTDAVAAYCGYQFVDEQLNPLYQIENRVFDSVELYAKLLNGNFLVPESLFVRRSAYERVGDFDPTLNASEDWDMWLRIAKTGAIIGTPSVLIKHRVVTGSMSSDPLRMLRARRRVLQTQLGEVTTSSALAARWAVGNMYLRSTVEYLGLADVDEARRCLQKMLTLCPELSTELAVFYELGVGGQSKGDRGDLVAIDLDESGHMMLCLLQEVYDDATLKTSDVSHYRQMSFANAYLALGLLNYGAGNMRPARRWLQRSVATRPKGIADRRIALTFLKSYFKPLVS